jgi:hypothetical protein
VREGRRCDTCGRATSVPRRQGRRGEGVAVVRPSAAQAVVMTTSGCAARGRRGNGRVSPSAHAWRLAGVFATCSAVAAQEDDVEDEDKWLSGPVISLLVLVMGIFIYCSYKTISARLSSSQLKEERSKEEEMAADRLAKQDEVRAMFQQSDFRRMMSSDQAFDRSALPTAPSQQQASSDPRLRGLFDSLDVDSSGALNREEITLMVQQQGMAVNQRFVDGVLDAFDADGSGFIEFDEFAALYTVLSKKSREASVSMI